MPVPRRHGDREGLVTSCTAEATVPHGSSPETEPRWFDKPALVARNSRSGYGLVFLVDPNRTYYLCTQYHGWDTAHDWAWDVGAAAGEPVTLNARLVYCRLDEAGMAAGLDALWERFLSDCAGAST